MCHSPCYFLVDVPFMLFALRSQGDVDVHGRGHPPAGAGPVDYRAQVLAGRGNDIQHGGRPDLCARDELVVAAARPMSPAKAGAYGSQATRSPGPVAVVIAPPDGLANS